MSKFRRYVKFAEVNFRPFEEGETLPSNVSISEADKAKGCPKVGDMIGVSDTDPNDSWLVEAETFINTYRIVD